MAPSSQPLSEQDRLHAAQLVDKYSEQLRRSRLVVGPGLQDRLRTPEQVTQEERAAFGKILRALEKANSPHTAVLQRVMATIMSVQAQHPPQPQMPTPRGIGNAFPPPPPGVAAADTIPVERPGSLIPFPVPPRHDNGNGAGGTIPFNEILSPPNGPSNGHDHPETIVPSYRRPAPALPQPPSGFISHRPAGILPAGAMSFQGVEQSQQLSTVDTLKYMLIPRAEELQATFGADTDAIAKGVMEVLETIHPSVVQAIFKNFSAENRMLPVPQFYIGKALILLGSQPGDFHTWLSTAKDQAEWQKKQQRCQWLQENVRATAADIDAPQRLDDFQNAYFAAQHSSQGMDDLISRWRVELGAYAKNAHHTLTRMAQLLTEQVALSNAHLRLAAMMIEQCTPMAKSRQMSPEMLSAFSALFHKVTRAQRAAHQQASAAPSPAQQPSYDDPLFAFDDAGFMDAVNAVNAKNQAIAKEMEAQEAAPQKPLIQKLDAEAEKQKAAVNALEDLIMFHPLNFVDKYLKLELSLPKTIKSLHLVPDPDCVMDPQSDDIPILGKGGTCVVVRLFDTKLGCPIAVRFDVHGLGSPEDAALALRGIAIHDKLVHPNIARSYGFDTLPMQITPREGKYQGENINVALNFQRVELIRNGVGLNQVISLLSRLEDENGVPDPQAVLHFLYRVSNALAFCHGMNVVHRDVKPDNIMFIPPEDWDGEDVNKLLSKGRVKVLDFGIARDNKNADADLTYAANGVLGTPVYIAPEGCVDAKDTRKPAGDVYALSMVLYDLITGQKHRHPMQVSQVGNSEIQNIDIEAFDRNRDGWMKIAFAIGSIKPHHPPIISPDDDLLKAFLSQGGPVAQLIVNMLVRMSHPDPDQRPSFEEILAFAERPLEYDMNRNGAVNGERPSGRKGWTGRFVDWGRSLFSRK